MKMTIVGNFTEYKRRGFNSFIIECNRGNHIYFVNDKDSAIKMLAK